MTRIHAAALAAALLGAAPGYGQKPPAPADNPNTLTLSKDGQAGQKCKVLKTYKHPSGGTAYEVKDEKTGEVMTVVENATPDQVKAVTTTEPTVTTTEVKPDAGDAKTGIKPLKADAKPSAKSANSPKPDTDPILHPGEYNGDSRLRQKVGPDGAAPPPAPKYTRPPVPATKRWFGWMQPAPAKAAVVSGRKLAPVVTPPPAAVPVMVEAAAHPDPVIRLIACLRDDLLPSMREVAAGELAQAAQGRPDAVEAILTAAQHDPAPGVRACCARKLAELKVRSPECLTTLKTLLADGDVAVRTEATNALAELYQP